MIRKNQFTNNNKYQCVKPEECHMDKLYSFSYNPEEQPLFEKFYKMKLNNLRDWSNQQRQILSSLRYCTVDVVQEISSKGRLHYHGYIMITDIVRFYLHDLAKLRHYGTYEIDHITDEDVWRTYVYKQERFMKQYCETNEMVYNITNDL